MIGTFKGFNITALREDDGSKLKASAVRKFGDDIEIRLSKKMLTLPRRQIQAVLLHEYGHIQSKHLFEKANDTAEEIANKTWYLARELEADKYALQAGFGAELMDTIAATQEESPSNYKLARLVHANEYLKQAEDKDRSAMLFRHMEPGQYSKFKRHVQNTLDERELFKSFINYNMDSPESEIGMDFGKINDFYKGIIHLDTETTGLRPNSSKLWSVGFSKDNSKSEAFLRNDLDSQNFNQFLNETSKSSSYQAAKVKEFFESGAGPYAAYKEAIDKGQALSLKNARKFVLSGLGTGGLVMSQNLNFENTFISNMFRDFDKNGDPKYSSYYDKLRSRMLYTKEGAAGDQLQNLLYKPPKVQMLSDKASDIYRQLVEAYNAKSPALEQLKSSYFIANQKVLEQYAAEKNLAERSGLLAFGDLQDFTKAFYSQAIFKGHFKDNAILGRASNIEYLAQVLLGEKEAHSAMSDAVQQGKIFNKLRNMMEELDSGLISGETKKTLGIFNSTMHQSMVVSAWSAANNAVEELMLQGKYQLSTANVLSNRDVPIKNNATGETTILSRKNWDFKSKIATSSMSDVLEDVSSRYRKYGLGKVADDIRATQYSSVEDLKAQLYNRLGQEKEKLSAEINSKRVIRESGAAKEALQVVKNIYKKISSSKTGSYTAIGLASLGLTYLLSDSKDSKDQSGQNTNQLRSRKITNTPSSVFEMYDKNNYPIIYNGQGYYHWDNRSGHHKPSWQA